MEKEINVADVVKSVSKKPIDHTIEIDKTGPFVHVTIPEYDGWIQLYMNEKKYGKYKVVDGIVSIQLSALPIEYSFRAEVLPKK